MSHDYERTRSRARTGAAHHDSELEPGRASRSAALHRPASAEPSGLVQCKSAGGLGAARLDGDAAVHEAAERGVSGAGSALPHLAAIQHSFGAHDVGGVRAFVGGGAASAAHDLGAHAYATGSAAAFASAPDLHTAAHEAAHVIQQRGGLQLDGGVGRAGDAHERHADAVADRVVQGASAEALLDGYATGGGGGGRGVQLLSFDDEELLDAYIDEKNKANDLNLHETVRRDKRKELSKTYPEGKKNGLKLAKADVDAWIKGKLTERELLRAEILAKQREKNQSKEQKAEPTTKTPAERSTTTDAPPSSSVSKRPTYSPLDLTQFPMAPLTGFSTVVAASASLPQPVTVTAPVDHAAPTIAKVNRWKASSGHAGCSETALTTEELQRIVDWAKDRPTKYFVKKGAGTGTWSAKNQLKIIHRQVMAGSKHATYHITADATQLAGLAIDEEDA